MLRWIAPASARSSLSITALSMSQFIAAKCGIAALDHRQGLARSSKATASMAMSGTVTVNSRKPFRRLCGPSSGHVLSRPGWTITSAISGQSDSQLVPNASIIGVLVNPNFRDAESQSKDVNEAGRIFGQQVHIAKASSERDLDTAFATFVQLRAGGLLVAVDFCLSAALTATSRPPARAPVFLSGTATRFETTSLLRITAKLQLPEANRQILYKVSNDVPFYLKNQRMN
jgi:hypothetical protein